MGTQRPPNDITARHVKWDQDHDWYSMSHRINGSSGLYKVVVKDHTTTMGIRYFENFQELRNWAGY